MELDSVNLLGSILYHTVSGSLMPMNEEKLSITTPLDQIILSQSQGDDILILGTK
jgi:hypothetical protein